MAYEKTLTFTEQPELSSPSTATSTWTFKYYSSGAEIAVNGETFRLAPYSNINKIYSNNANGKTHASTEYVLAVITGDVRRNYRAIDPPIKCSPDQTITSVPLVRTVNTADYFNSSNPTTRTITSRQYVRAVKLQSGAYSDGAFVAPYGIATYGDVDNPSTDMSDWIDLGEFMTYTLDAPPIISNPSVTYNTSEPYADLTTATLACNVTAQYGGNISNIVFKVGNQSVSGTTTPLSIRLTAEGTFTPTVTVTDSRGQTTTQNLDSVVVKACPPPAMSFTAQRTTASGVVDDEGQYATLTAVFDYASDAVALREPVVLVDGVQETATWYTTRATSGAVSNAVDWTNTGSFTSPKTLYGIVGTLDLQTSHQISATPVDSNASGTTITQTLATAFYTLDFLAGGHGIAFGQPASQDGFECNMPTTFHDTVGCEDTLTAQDMTTQEVSDFVDSLDVGGSGVAVDLVVEQGTSGIWTYRKWSSGIAECWGYYSKSIAPNSVDNSNYITFPFTFTATPNIVLGLSAGGAELYRGHIENSSTNATQVRLTLINQYTSSIVLGMNIHAIGRWK